MHPATQKNGTLVCEYVLLYTDDFLVVSEITESIFKEDIGRYFELKPDSIGPSSLCLGGHLREVTLDIGVKAWIFVSAQYVQAPVKNVEEYLRHREKSLNAKGLDVIPKYYRPKIDISEELGAQEASYFKHLIGVL